MPSDSVSTGYEPPEILCFDGFLESHCCPCCKEQPPSLREKDWHSIEVDNPKDPEKKAVVRFCCNHWAVIRMTLGAHLKNHHPMNPFVRDGLLVAGVNALFSGTGESEFYTSTEFSTPERGVCQPGGQPSESSKSEPIGQPKPPNPHNRTPRPTAVGSSPIVRKGRPYP